MRIPLIKYNHQKYLNDLEKIPQNPSDYKVLYFPADYRLALLEAIKNAKKRIYIIALYLEKDEAGQEVLKAIYEAKKSNPTLEVNILVDWHRAQRGRVGEKQADTNAGFYFNMKQQYPDVNVPVYGVPVNRREVLGVLHLKGSIIDDTLIYTGASINNVYLHQLDKYRYDRYHLLTNPQLAQTMINYIKQHFLANEPAVQPLDTGEHKTRKQLKHDIKAFRHKLCQTNYHIGQTAQDNTLAVTPIAGVGRANQLNKTIHHLISSTTESVVFCTPYFNLPHIVIKDIMRLLKRGKKVEIIVGDKTANDFFIPESEPFNIIGGLPYLYEINLRKFVEKLQHYVDDKLLTVRLWKDDDHTYHLKGIWVDEEWVLITGNNLNPRAWRLDLENGVLVHDPKHELAPQLKKELEMIREKTLLITHFQQIQASQFYPKQVHKLINRLSRIKIDRIIKRLL